MDLLREDGYYVRKSLKTFAFDPGAAGLGARKVPQYFHGHGSACRVALRHAFLDIGPFIAGPLLGRLAPPQAVHGLLYIALLVQPVLGWSATAAGGYPIEFFNSKLPALIAKDPALSKTLYSIHFGVGLLIVALIAVHVGAALMHRFVKRDTVMHRMSLF